MDVTWDQAIKNEDQIGQEIEQNRAAFAEKLDRIRANPDLNDGARRRMISEAYEEATATHNELVQQKQATEQVGVEALEHSLFEVPIPPGVSVAETEIFRQSYRDASFRVQGMDPAKLEAALEHAERTGDYQLAAAVYHEAVQQGYFDVADRYRSRNPGAKQLWDAYTEARTQAEDVNNILFGAIPPQRPEELGRR